VYSDIEGCLPPAGSRQASSCDYWFVLKENKMKLSRSIGYAVLAVGYVAQHQVKKSVLSQDISKEYDIPLEYLLKILQQLVRANVLRSKRGPHGGFALAKAANKITMLHIIEAVDGPMTSQLNLGGSRFGVRAERVYEKAIEQAKTVLLKTRLSDLL
jgi:Rrf2 family protein